MTTEEVGVTIAAIAVLTVVMAGIWYAIRGPKVPPRRRMATDRWLPVLDVPKFTDREMALMKAGATKLQEESKVAEVRNDPIEVLRLDDQRGPCGRRRRGHRAGR